MFVVDAIDQIDPVLGRDWQPYSWPGPSDRRALLSTPLFADVPVDMNEVELKISRSTPTAQLNA